MIKYSSQVLLFLIGILSILFQFFEMTFYVSVIFSNVVILASTFMCLKNSRRIFLGEVFFLALGLGYCLGTLNTMVNLLYDDLTIFDAYNLQSSDLNITYGCLLISISFLYAVARFERSPILAFLNHKITPTNSDLLLLLLVLSGLLYSYSTGMLGFQGALTAEGAENISIFGSVFSSLAAPVAALSIFLYFKSAERYKEHYLVIFLIIFVLFFTQGRRVLIYAFFLCVLCLFAAGFVFDIRRPKVVVSTVLLILLSYFGFNLFFAMRIATWSLPVASPITDIVSAGIDVFSNKDKYDFDYLISENVGSRTFVLEYLSSIFNRVIEIGPSYGDTLYFAFRMAMPSFLDESKNEFIRIGSEEAIIHPRLGLPVWDAANSIFTAGAADFGFLGFLMYPVLILYLLRMAFDLISQYVDWQVKFILVCMLITVFLNAEASLSVYLVTLRALIVYAVVLQLYYKLANRFFRINHAHGSLGKI